MTAPKQGRKRQSAPGEPMKPTRYQCFGCQTEWSTDNMVAYCASCYHALDSEVRALRCDLENVQRQYEITDSRLRKVQAEVAALREERDRYRQAAEGKPYMGLLLRAEAAENEAAALREAHNKISERLRMWEEDGPEALLKLEAAESRAAALEKENAELRHDNKRLDAGCRLPKPCPCCAEAAALKTKIEQKELDRQYHMNAINRLGSAMGMLDYTSDAIVEAALTRIAKLACVLPVNDGFAKQNSALKSKVEAEHDLYLTAHRDNMKAATMLMEKAKEIEALQAQLARKDEEINKLRAHFNDGKGGTTLLTCWYERQLKEERQALERARKALEEIAYKSVPQDRNATIARIALTPAASEAGECGKKIMTPSSYWYCPRPFGHKGDCGLKIIPDDEAGEQPCRQCGSTSKEHDKAKHFDAMGQPQAEAGRDKK